MTHLSDAVLAAQDAIQRPGWCSEEGCRACAHDADRGICAGICKPHEPEWVRLCCESEGELITLSAWQGDWYRIMSLIHGAMGDLMEYWARS